MIGDVLDLVGDRTGVDGAEERQRLEQRVALDIEAEERGREPRLELRRQRRHEARLVERGVADRLGAERIEPSGEMPVHPIGLDERHRCGHAAEEGVVDGRRLLRTSCLGSGVSTTARGGSEAV